MELTVSQGAYPACQKLAFAIPFQIQRGIQTELSHYLHSLGRFPFRTFAQLGIRTFPVEVFRRNGPACGNFMLNGRIQHIPAFGIKGVLESLHLFKRMSLGKFFQRRKRNAGFRRIHAPVGASGACSVQNAQKGFHGLPRRLLQSDKKFPDGRMIFLHFRKGQRLVHEISGQHAHGQVRMRRKNTLHHRPKP